jgi:hypothetical protein
MTAVPGTRAEGLVPGLFMEGSIMELRERLAVEFGGDLVAADNAMLVPMDEYEEFEEYEARVIGMAEYAELEAQLDDCGQYVLWETHQHN